MRPARFSRWIGLALASVCAACGSDEDGGGADTVAGASGAGGGTSSLLPDAGSGAPAPMRIQNPEGDLSFEARGFIGAYCALFEPCCTVGGLTSRCSGRVGAAAFPGSYDPSAGEACLAAVRRRQPSADFCAGLERPTGIEVDVSWAALPECAAVFVPEGGTAPGGACTKDSDCAPGANGAAFCFTSGTCVQTSKSAGDRCFGDFARDLQGRALATYQGAQPNVFLCDNDRSVRCDSVTRVCVAVQPKAVGAACAGEVDCDANSFCSPTNTCAARLPVGATCASSAECQGVCDLTSLRCANPVASGAACTGDVGLCATGNCIDSRCSSLIPSVCGG